MKKKKQKGWKRSHGAFNLVGSRVRSNMRPSSYRLVG